MSDQEQATATASIATQVQLKPRASQTFLVSMAVLAGACIFLGSGLLMLEKDAGWFIASLSIMFAGGALWGWRTAQSDTDMHASPPTTISLADGSSVSTDSRNLRYPIAVKGLIDLVEAQRRVKLPEADGIVENGVPVPGSFIEANNRVRQINDEADQQVRAFEALVNPSQHGPMATQRPMISVPPEANAASLNETAPGNQ